MYCTYCTAGCTHYIVPRYIHVHTKAINWMPSGLRVSFDKYNHVLCILCILCTRKKGPELGDPLIPTSVVGKETTRQEDPEVLDIVSKRLREFVLYKRTTIVCSPLLGVIASGL